MIPGTVKKCDGKSVLMVMSARTIPFRTAKIAKVISPKFMRVSFFRIKIIPTQTLAIAAMIENALSSQSGMLRKPEFLDVSRRARRAYKIRDTASGVTKLIWRGSDSIHWVTEFASRGDEKSFDFSRLLPSRMSPTIKLPISQGAEKRQKSS